MIALFIKLSDWDVSAFDGQGSGHEFNGVSPPSRLDVSIKNRWRVPHPILRPLLHCFHLPSLSLQLFFAFPFAPRHFQRMNALTSWQNLWNPGSGFVNNMDGGRAGSALPDYRQD
jgi:hypothetical protein